MYLSDYTKTIREKRNADISRRLYLPIPYVCEYLALAKYYTVREYGAIGPPKFATIRNYGFITVY